MKSIGRLSIAAACGLAAAACNPELAAIEQAPAAVRFTTKKMWIDRLGIPLAPPVQLGAALSPLTLRSSNPNVVEVDEKGRLIARANGEAVIEAVGIGGDRVEITVRAVQSLSLRPSVLRLRPGASAAIELLGDGDPLPVEAARWAMSDPSIAHVDQRAIVAGQPGAARIVATVGHTTAELNVMVERTSGTEATP